MGHRPYIIIYLCTHETPHIAAPHVWKELCTFQSNLYLSTYSFSPSTLNFTKSWDTVKFVMTWNICITLRRGCHIISYSNRLLSTSKKEIVKPEWPLWTLTIYLKLGPPMKNYMSLSALLNSGILFKKI